jgi:DNA-binding NarL/FixJ family response regulator
MKRILLADDHELLLQGLRAALETVPEWCICGSAKDGREAVELAGRLLPDVAILDPCMPELNGLEAARQIRHAASPKTEVLMLTGSDSEELSSEACAVGARGYVLKTDGVAAVLAGVRAMTEGRPYFSPGVRYPPRAIAGRAPAPPPPRRGSGESIHGQSKLTPREREIAQLLVEGKTNWCIANSLGISVKTVETHRAHIMRKLGLESIVELVHYAVHNLMVAS